MLVHLEKLRAATADRQQKMESYPKMVYDPVRHDVRRYLEEQMPERVDAVSKIGVHRLLNGYGGIFLAGQDPFYYVMTGKGFKFKRADGERALDTLSTMLDLEQRRSIAVRRNEAKKDYSELVFDLSDPKGYVNKSKRKKLACSKCGGTAYSDIRMGLGDCCIDKSFVAFLQPVLVLKALPKPKEEKVKQAPKPIAAGAKKQGAGAGKPRYNYPTEKGKPGAAPQAKPKTMQAEHDEQAPEQEQQQNGQPEPQQEPKELEFVDPAKLAALLHTSVGVLRKVALKFQRNPNIKGRTGFVDFMRAQLGAFVKKHNLDDKYIALCYDALVGSDRQPKPIKQEN